MADLIAIYDRMVIALRGNDDATALSLFAPEFVVQEDPGMPYGGEFHGGAGFIALRHKVREYWKLEIVAKCAEPGGDHLVIALKLTGHPGGPTDGLETLVTVFWTFRDGKAVAAKVLYFDTPRMAAAIAGNSRS